MPLLGAVALPERVHGSGGSQTAAILGASGFDITGIRHHAGVLRKDVDLMLDVARAAGAAEPTTVADLARQTLATLDGPDDHARR